MPDWRVVAALKDIPSDEPLIVAVGDQMLALYRLGDQAFTTDGFCTHEAQCLDGAYVEGSTDGGTVECPYHSAVYDIITGAVLDGPAQSPLPVFPTKTEDGAVYVDLQGRGHDG